MTKRNYLLASEVDERIAEHRILHECNRKLIRNTVSVFCYNCHHYKRVIGDYCSLREDTLNYIYEGGEIND